MSETVSYTVPGIHCDHCEHAVGAELSAVEGVEFVDVDLETKLVTVVGDAGWPWVRASIGLSAWASARSSNSSIKAA